jgi:high-affinity nickel-transport protein
MVALVIGTVELAVLFAQKLGAQLPFGQWVENINLKQLGFIIVGLFVLTSTVALTIWRLGRIEERCTP